MHMQTFCEIDQLNWLKFLSLIELCYKKMVSRCMRNTPFFLCYAQETTQPQDLVSVQSKFICDQFNTSKYAWIIKTLSIWKIYK